MSLYYWTGYTQPDLMPAGGSGGVSAGVICIMHEEIKYFIFLSYCSLPDNKIP